MNKKERITAVRAMDFLARSVNNEELLIPWFMEGVADGDIDEDTTDEELEDYVNDDVYFSELMELFLKTMSAAREDGGLYVDGIVSND